MKKSLILLMAAFALVSCEKDNFKERTLDEDYFELILSGVIFDLETGLPLSGVPVSHFYSENPLAVSWTTTRCDGSFTFHISDTPACRREAGKGSFTVFINWENENCLYDYSNIEEKISLSEEEKNENILFKDIGFIGLQPLGL